MLGCKCWVERIRECIWNGLFVVMMGVFSCLCYCDELVKVVDEVSNLGKLCWGWVINEVVCVLDCLLNEKLVG